MLRGQSPPAGSQRGAPRIPSLAFLAPGPPTSFGSRGGMEIILLACVCVCLSVSAQRCETWGTTSAGRAAARGLREAPAARRGAGRWDAGMLGWGMMGCWDAPGWFPLVPVPGLPPAAPSGSRSHGRGPLRFLGRRILCP